MRKTLDNMFEEINEFDFENRVVTSDCDINTIAELDFPETIKSKLTGFVNYVKTTGDVANLLLVGCPSKYISHIANTIANEIDVSVKEFGSLGTKPGDLAIVLTNINEGDVVYLTNDSLSSREAKKIFDEALHNYTITVTIGKGLSARTIHLPILKFCAILFVDNISQVPPDVLDSFYQVIDFSRFKQELRVMDISNFATKYNLDFTQSAKEEIVKQCVNEDQIKLKLIEIRNRAFEEGITTITEDFLQGKFASIPEFEKINTLDGREFELFTGNLFRGLGYTDVTVTQSSCDFGADVIAEKDDVRFAIQCKRYSVPVGISAVQEVIASKSLHDCHVACILTNNIFTPAAKELARKNLVILWDGNKLKEFIKRTT